MGSSSKMLGITTNPRCRGCLIICKEVFKKITLFSYLGRQVVLEVSLRAKERHASTNTLYV